MRHSILNITSPLLAALVAVLLIGVAALQVWPLGLTTAVPHPRLLSGLHGIEQFAELRASWTKGQAELALPRLPLGTAALLSLRLHNGRIGEQPDPLLTLAADDRPLGSFRLLRRIDGTRRYRLLIPPTHAADWATRISITSETIRPPGDQRDLGVVLVAAQLAPVAYGGQGSHGEVPLLPAPWYLGWGALFGLAAYLLPRCAGLGRGVSVATSVALAGLVAFGIVLRPLELLPFLQRLVALLLLVCAAVGLARLLSGAARDAHGRLTISGERLPIFLGVAWWTMLAYQVVMLLDGAEGVYPGSMLLWMGAVVGVGLIALAVWGSGVRAEGASARSPIPDPRSLAARWALWLLAGAALLALAEQLRFAFTRSAPDFWILFRGTREWARGGSLYDLKAVATNHFGHVFKVPPFYAMLFGPFVFQDGLAVLLGHRILNLLLLAATLLAWWQMWNGLSLRLHPGQAAIGYRLSAILPGLLILANFRPLVDTLAFGQIDLALLLLLTLALWALREERDLLAGALIAAGALFKIYPILLLAFLVVKRSRRGLAGFALAMLLLNGVAVAVMGWEMHRVYLTEVLPRIGGTTSWVENQTISGFLARLVATPTEAFILRERVVTLAGLVAGGVLGLLACGLSLGVAERRSTRFALQYGQFLLLMVLAVPAAWMHYQTLLFLVFGALLLHLREREVALPQATALGAAFALIGFGNQWSFYDGTVMGVLTILGISYKFYGMLLLGGVLLSVLLAECAPARSEQPMDGRTKRQIYGPA